LFNGNNYDGELELLPELVADFPDEFDFNEDLEFNWNIDAIPQLFLVVGNLEYYWGGDYYEEYERWQLSGITNNFAIPQSFYSAYEECDEYRFYAGINAINFNTQNRFLIYSLSDDNKDYGDYYLNNQSSGFMDQLHKKDIFKIN